MHATAAVSTPEAGRMAVLPAERRAGRRRSPAQNIDIGTNWDADCAGPIRSGQGDFTDRGKDWIQRSRPG